MTGTLFHLFKQAAEKNPSHPALVAGETELTYGDILSRTHEFGAEMRQAGLRPGDRVAVVLGNTPEFVVAAFALWQTGAVLLPLHVRFQREEIVKYILDCGARGLIAAQRKRGVVQDILKQSVGVDHAWLTPQESNRWDYLGSSVPSTPLESSGPNPDEIVSNSPALTQYSTGSTGFSKRVTRSHQDLIGEYNAVAKVMEFAATDRILGVVPFFHNYGLMNAVLCSLLSGATLYAVDSFFPRDIALLIERKKITGFPGVPFMYQLLADLPKRPDLSSLRYATSAGAPLPESAARGFKAAYGVTIRQLYGTTETGVISIERPGVEAGKPSVGLPIPGVSVRILDDSLHVVADGGEGQLAVTSPFAASGYNNQVGKTESFFQDGMFFPGDLGSIDSNGQIVLVGRKRQFINVAGNKVDPAELEAVLHELPGVLEAVVVGLPDGSADEKIKAVLVTSAPCTRTEILKHCSAKLADFKLPRVIEFRKEIPKSPLGKILRKYLIQDQNETSRKYEFDPQLGFRPRKETLSAAPPPDSLSTIPAFLRALLVTDGTVTKILEAYFWEPIEVESLLHAQTSSDRPFPEIHVLAGDSIIRRRVILRGGVSGAAYGFAETIVASKEFPTELAKSLMEGSIGIGQLLRDFHLETYREILSIQRHPAGEFANHLGIPLDAEVLARAYIICLGRRASILITEIFPLARFQFPH